MNKSLRSAVIAGNWKMNKTPSETTALINEMKPLVKDADCDVVLCVPFVDIAAAVEASKGSNIKIGAENVHFETDVTVNLRTKAAVNAGLTAIVCVGETLEQREQGITKELLAMQTKIALKDVKAEQLKNIIIAYEPVWAIGTGVTATADQANEGNAAIRAALAEMFGADKADSVTIQYGGSMNAKNADELLAKPDVDGGLIGGASLKAEDFSIIVKAASK